MRILAANTSGQISFSSLPPECIACARQCASGTKKVLCQLDSEERRQGRKKGSDGDVYICSNDKDFLRSKKLFMRLVDGFYSLLPQIQALRKDLEAEANLKAFRLIHNLKSLNAHSLQDIYALVPQEQLTRGDFTDQVQDLSQIIESNAVNAAKTILRLNKHQNAAKCEFGSFEVLNTPLPTITKKNHPIRRVVLNTLHTFFADFTDKGIFVDVAQCDERVDLHYETFQVALYHLIHNATKYIQDNTSMSVEFKRNESFVVDFEMTSLEIRDDDIDRIFDDGFSSDDARRRGLSGDGLGLGIVKKLLLYNGGKLEIIRNLPEAHMHGHYRRNSFRVHLPI